MKTVFASAAFIAAGMALSVAMPACAQEAKEAEKPAAEAPAATGNVYIIGISGMT